MTAAITSRALLSVADELSAAKDPTAVRARRAVSSAYYAVFHGLVADATALEIGGDPARAADREQLSRWYGHRDMRVVSEWVLRRARGGSVPDGVELLLDAPREELVAVAESFVELQHARHDADYNHRGVFDEETAQEAVAAAREVLELMEGLAGDRVYGNYLALMGAARRVGR